jgi:hypothetical protein
MIGDVVSIAAHRNVAFRTDGWRVQFKLWPTNNQPNLVLVSVFNFNGSRVLDVYRVSRVQFVPSTQDNEFYLRLYTHLPGRDESVVVNDPNNPAPLLLSTVPHFSFLRFNLRDVEASRHSWITNVGWQLLRYTDGNSFFWQAKQEPDQPVEAQPEIPAEQDYDISELLAAGQLTDTDINSWKCAICKEGIAEGRQLVSAHKPSENGTLHVFHRQCLEPWMDRRQTCPTCRAPSNPKPLPEVWSAGTYKVKCTHGREPVHRL